MATPRGFSVGPVPLEATLTGLRGSHVGSFEVAHQLGRERRFRSAHDIAAITVNRWPHGYAYVEDSLFDPQRDGSPPYEVGRRRCGNVTIANSDAAWNAYTHEAIDQAWRAVNELKSV